MHSLRRVWEDIRQGENFELYVTLIAAIALTFHNLTGLLPQPLASSLTPTVLALIAISLLNDRHQRKDLYRITHELRDRGIESAFDTFPQNLFEQKCYDANSEIRILSTWIPGVNPISPGLANALRRGVKVQFLILDPASVMADYRRRNHNFSLDHPATALDALKSSLNRQKLPEKSSIEIRIYDAIPPFYLRMIDDWMLIGFYWHGYGSSEGPMFSIYDRNSRFGKYMIETFENIWQQAKVFTTFDNNSPTKAGA